MLTPRITAVAPQVLADLAPPRRNQNMSLEEGRQGCTLLVLELGSLEPLWHPLGGGGASDVRPPLPPGPLTYPLLVHPAASPGWPGFLSPSWDGGQACCREGVSVLEEREALGPHSSPYTAHTPDPASAPVPLLIAMWRG